MRVRLIAYLCSAFFLGISRLASDTDQILNYIPAGSNDIQDTSTPEVREVAKEMSTIIIHRVDFENTDVSVALNFLNAEIKKQTPAGKKPIFIHLASSLAHDDVKPFFQHKVSITLEDCPLGDVLAYIWNQTKLSFIIIPNREVQFYSPEFEKARRDTVERMANLKIDRIDFHETDIEKFIAVLNQKCQASATGQNALTIVYRPRLDDLPLSKIRHKTITMKLDGAPLLDILQDAMPQTDFEFTVEPNTVVIRPGRTDD